MSDTRERIVAAAREILNEGAELRPSVRAVAARAGIGASTLRHYFPTQRALYEAVLRLDMDEMMTDLRIADSSVPPRDRLVECLNQLLPPMRAGDQALQFWFRTLSGANATRDVPEVQASWALSVRQARARVAEWLDQLAAEGATRDCARDRNTRLLLAVIDGLAIGRIVPEEHLTTQQEQVVLFDAVDAVLVDRVDAAQR